MSSASAYAPGRVEFLGNHTDYNEGVVLAAAIDRGLTVSGFSGDDRRLVLTSLALGRRVEVPLARLEPQAKEPWANYALGVVHELIEEGFEVGSFRAEVSGDLPPGAGLSSSAAFEVATARFLMKLHRLEIPDLVLAKLCQRAENRFVGVRSGLLDQVTSIFGRANHLVFLDCRSEEVRTIPFPEDMALLIADSGVKHSLARGQYNTRREECADAAEALGVRALRDISAHDLQTFTGSLDPLLRRRAAHIMGENERVWRALDSLEAGDAVALGALMNASHESSRTNFENSTQELDLLTGIARSLPGVLGSRLTGGGFGGATVSLVRASAAATAARQLGEEYAARARRPAQVFICRIADGAE
ncbi:MAG: galactokinase [Verrucomicrobiota bacterium]|nr:galactokinase [Verrucomicrobiota bacterium]